MAKNERTVVELEWDTNGTGAGKFEAVIINGELKHFMGISPNGSLDVYSNDYKFLMALRDKLTEMEEVVKTQTIRTSKNAS